MVTITGKTVLTGLIGDPIEHSISPQLHNTLYSLMDINSVYLPFKVPQGELEKVAQVLKVLNVKGFNVTIPYKTEIIKYLDGLTEEAKLIGAVNTVMNINDRLIGYNTDGYGFLKSLKINGFEPEEKNVIVLGAGGAARSVVIKLAQSGAKRIAVLNRSVDKAEDLCKFANEEISNVCTACSLSREALKEYSYDCSLVVNTTPVGTWPETEKTPIEEEWVFKSKPVVYDLIYNPKKTKLLSLAEENSCQIINGLGMLVYQGVRAFEIWNDVKIPDEEIDKIINNFKDNFR